MPTGFLKPKLRAGITLRNWTPFLAAKPLVFDHIPKCGGSTVTKYLYRQYQPNHIFQIDGRRPHESVEQFRSLPQKLRHRYRLVVGHLAHELLDEVHPDSISMTILREPVDRAISHYYYVLRDTEHYLHERVCGGKIDLREYVSKPVTSEVRNWCVSHFSGRRFKEVEADRAAALEIAMNTVIQRYHLVGFLDDLATSMNELKTRARFHSYFKNDQFNKTGDRPGLNAIESETIEMIRDLNSLDIELFQRLKRHFSMQEPATP